MIMRLDNMYRKIIITHTVWKEIEITIGNINPEAGGILGKRNEKIEAYYFDRTGVFLEDKYIPDVKQVNRVITDWTEYGISFCGFIHSHLLSHKKPSYGDIEYAKQILRNNGLKKLYLIIYVMNSNDKVLFYELYQNGMVNVLDYEIN